MCVTAALPFAAPLPAAETPEVYLIHVQSHNAMIVRNPSGQTMIVDGGMPNDRDLGRVTSAAQALGIEEFDVYLITHYDVDHLGNVPAIYERYPAKLLVDHGPLLPNPKLASIN